MTGTAAPAKPTAAQGTLVPQTLERALRPGEVSLDELERAFRETAIEQSTQGNLVPQTLERALRPGEVSLDELERAFRETEAEVAPAPKQSVAPEKREAAAKEAKPAASKSVVEVEVQEADKIANQSIRVNVDTLEHLMTMVSELGLTPNHLLDISSRNQDTDLN